MGISGLLPLLKSVSNPIHIKEWKGKTVAVDAYVWLHRGAYGCAEELATGKKTTKYVNYSMHRVRMLLHHGVTPIIVFDGGLLPSKMGTEGERGKRRSDALAKGNALLAEGKKSQARDCFVKGVDVTPEMAYQLIKALRREGVQYIVAPYEADPQLAYLERVGIVDGIITEDSDLLVFGCRAVLFKLDSDGNCVEVLRSKFAACKEYNFAGWTDQEFRQMAILSGCDYLDSIPGMGLKTAYSLMRKYRKAERVVQYVRLAGTLKVPVNYLEAFERAELTFRHQFVFDPISKLLVHCTPLPEGLTAADLPFAGAPMSDEYAQGLANGDIDPLTKLPMVDINPEAFADHSSTAKPRAKASNAKNSTTPAAGTSSLLNYFTRKPVAATVTPISRKVLGKVVAPVTARKEVEEAPLQSKFFGKTAAALARDQVTSKGKGKAVQQEFIEIGDDDDEFPADEDLEYEEWGGPDAEAEAFMMERDRVELELAGLARVKPSDVARSPGPAEFSERREEEDEEINYDNIFPRPEHSYAPMCFSQQRDAAQSSFADVTSPVASTSGSNQKPVRVQQPILPTLDDLDESLIWVKTEVPMLEKADMDDEDGEIEEKPRIRMRGSSTDGGISSPAPSSLAGMCSSPEMLSPTRAGYKQVEIIKMEKQPQVVAGAQDDDSDCHSHSSGKRERQSDSDPIHPSSQSLRTDDVENVEDTPRPLKKNKAKGKAPLLFRADINSSPVGVEKQVKLKVKITAKIKKEKVVPILDEDDVQRNEAMAIVAAGWRAKFSSPAATTSMTPQPLHRLPTPTTTTAAMLPQHISPPALAVKHPLARQKNKSFVVAPPAGLRTPLSPKTNTTRTNDLPPLPMTFTSTSVNSGPSKRAGPVDDDAVGQNPKLLRFRFQG